MSGGSRTSIGRKIAIAVVAPVGLIALAGFYASWRHAERAVLESSTENAAALADLVATSFALVRDQPPGTPAAHEAVAAVMGADWRMLAGVRDVRVVDGKGVVRWSRRPEDVGRALPEAARLLAAAPGGGFAADYGEFAHLVGGISCARCHVGDAMRLGAVQLVMDEPRLKREMKRLFVTAGLATLALGLLVAGISFGVARVTVVRPLERLSAAMVRAKSGDFLTRAPVETGDEMGLLAETFNEMLARITDLKVQEIDRSREVELLQRELSLKQQVERQSQVIEETNRELAERVRQLTLLFDVTRSINSTLEFGEILKLITDMVGVTLGFREFSMMLYDEAPKLLVVKAAYGPGRGEALGDERFRLGEGAAGLAAQNKEIVYIEDTTSDPRYAQFGGARNREGSLLCIPMLFKDKLVGVLNFSRPQPAAFGPEETKLLQSVANQAAMAIVNARLFQETVELSLTDPLTGVANRRHLFAQLEMEVRRAQRFETPVSFVMIDIDHFKKFNDACGHPAGDALLQAIATLLSQNVRKVDTLARYGGEEFGVILPKIRKAEATDVAEKLRKAVLRTDFKNGEKQMGGRVTISLGVSNLPDDAQTLEKLVDAADSALYASKRGGRNLATAYQPGMEFHPGRERGPYAKKKTTGERSSGSPPKPQGPTGAA